MSWGIVKQLAGKTKFLGKVFVVDNYLEGLDGSVVHYREEESTNVIAFKLDNAFCVDVDAWEFAKAQGAKFLCAYLVDKKAFVYAEANFVNNAPIRILKANEGPQRRVDGKRLMVWRKAPKPPNVPFIPDADCIDLDVWARG